MTIAEVLASVDGGEGSEALIRTALAVGRRFDAHVDLIHVESLAEDAIPLVGDGLAGPAVTQILRDAERAAKDRTQAAHAAFEKVCLYGEPGSARDTAVIDVQETPPRGRFSVTWRQLEGRPDHELARRGRLADMIVLAKAADGSGLTVAIETALFDTGRPVLLAPAESESEFGNRIAVAWDGSKEAARAVAAALPFIEKAHEVLIVTVGETDEDPQALQAYLAQHGVSADCRKVASGAGGVGKSLLEAARSARCDLLVMGGYGHSRLRELVLGGATDRVLRDASIPVLLAH